MEIESSKAPENHSALFDQKAIERGAAADARWFRRHPERSYRIRRAINKEWPETRNRWTVVWQIEPGVRMRVPVRIEGEGWQLPDTDEELAVLYRLKVEGRPAVIIGGRVFDAAAYSHGGMA